MSMTFPSSPTVGQQYSVSGGPTYTWDGSVWKVLTPGQQYSPTIFTATAGQTTFTISGGYVIGAIDVFKNGVKLVNGQDYAATDLATVVLSAACSAGDSVEIITLAQILYSQALKKTGDTMTGDLTVPNLTVNGNLTTPGFVTVINASTNSTYLTLSNTATGGKSFSLYSSGGGPSVAGTFGIYDNSSGAGARLIIDGSGNVGIGASSPASKLDVNGGIGISYSGAAKLSWGYSGQYLNWIECGGVAGNNYMRFATGNSEQMRLNTTGALVLAGGNTAASGVGIAFPATQSASSDANTLDDYEEGTWTPVDSSGASLTLSVNGAQYIKIGQMVWLYCYVTYPTTSNALTASIGGLPFTSISGAYPELTVRPTSGVSSGIVAQISSAATTLVMYAVNSGGPVPNSSLSTQGVLVTGCYRANN